MPNPKSKPNTQEAELSPAAEIDAIISALGDWRGEMLAQLRGLIKQAAPGVVEEVKWRKPTNPGGVPVWSLGGIICTGETYKDKVKLTFMNGAGIADPTGIFNSSLDGNARRAMDVRAGEKVNASAFKALVRAAVALNTSSDALDRPVAKVPAKKGPKLSA